MPQDLITLSIKSTEFANWALTMRIPDNVMHHRVIMLFHGWTGDESSMWVFASRLPKDAILIAARGVYPVSAGGYGWHPYKAGKWPHLDDFRFAVDAVLELLNPKIYPDGYFHEGDLNKVGMLGFSQGAAMVYAFSLLYSERVESIAGLSGFLPQGSSSVATNAPLEGKPVFVAHGTHDQLVPVERARKAVRILRSAGGQVTYCEDDVGHKLSVDCFRGLEKFYSRLSL